MLVYIRLQGAASEYEWQHGTVVRRLETDATARMAVVELADGRLVEVNEERDVLMANTCDGESAARMRLADVDNLDALTHLHEASFVDYLQQRYVVDQVYCRSGSVLIAVNPFKEIRGMYDMPAYMKRLDAMHASGQRDDAKLPPHVFSMAESAYQSLRRRRRLASEPKKNQTILVSGESGAGKTESTKFIMQYLAAISSPTATETAASMPDLTKFLLSANPILESFGNARTLRNDNSSRFGKFVRMFFNEPDAVTQHMQMVRTTVETYLLERVRVVHQGLGERNFHIFYELLKGATPEMRQQLHLGNLRAQDFQFVNVGRCYERNDKINDAHQFANVLEAMAVIGFSREEQMSIWRIVSALLHLGNVGFVPPTGHEDDDPTNAPPCVPSAKTASKLSSDEHLSMASHLLALDQADLVAGLTVRTINVSGETFQVNLTQTQCADTRDAAARSLYGWIFQYLVKRINETSPDPFTGDDKDDKRPCISVLDIFGFEEFDVNQFEQFCINYANEKLQFQFIQDILQSEQDAHMQEGVKWEPVDYSDNTQCLEMIEQRPGGIFSLLDEECLMPKGSDASFARKMYLQMKQQPTFVASNKDQVDFAFQVHHYAGHVKYSASGFCEKNKDQPNAELLNLLKQTDDKDLEAMFIAFEENDAATKPPPTERPKIRRRASVIGAVGIGSQFKQQLGNLLEVVQQTQTHYIRCIKPNDQNTRGLFDLAKVARQLRYGGVLKAVEIMRQSFPVRMPHQEFLSRYEVLTRQAKKSIDVISLVKLLKITGAEVGRTRVFIRQAAFDQLERDRDGLLSSSAICIQTKWRGLVSRRKYCRILKVLRSIQLRWRAISQRRRLMHRRIHAAVWIQRYYRAWQSRTAIKRALATLKIQRSFRRWSSLWDEVVSVDGTTAEQAPLPKAPRQPRTREPVVSSREFTIPPSPFTEDSRSTAGESESSWMSDRPAHMPSVAAPTPPNSVGPSVSSANDKELLKHALGELERLRLRAAAAEAALAQIAGQSGQDYHVPPAPSSLQYAPQSFSPFKANGQSLYVDSFGSTALHTIVETGGAEEVYNLLVNNSSSLELLNRSENQRGFTPLHAAVRRGCVDVLGIFFRPDVLPHVNINAADRDGNTPLHVAVQLNDELADRVMELLLCFGADPNATNYLKQTPLHLCTMVQREPPVGVELMEKLLRNSGDPSCVDLLKRTPLHYAVDKGMDDVATLLVKHGADMNIPDAEGQRVVTHPKGTHLLRYLRATPSWIPDADIAGCMICQEPFSYFFGRKCHCDRCGRVCCSDCCPSSSNWNGRFCFDCKHYQHLPPHFKKEGDDERSENQLDAGATMEAEKQLEGDAGFMDKYSRQIGAFGLETMAKLVKLKVLIVGLQGVGMEAAKNLILAGPGAITLHDDTPAQIKDLGTNFFLSEQDVGEPRAVAVSHKLAELNKMVTVSVHKGPLTEAVVGAHNVVVFSHTARSELLKWNHFCRTQSPAIGFILCDIRGAMGYTFTDYGDKFVTHDATGEAPITRIITDITNDKDGMLSILGPDEDGKMHEMPDSDHDGWVEISEVEGMRLKSDPEKNINNMGPRRIKFASKKMFRNGKQVEVFDAYRLKIGDTSDFTPYEGGGILTQHKKPFVQKFYSLEESLVNPVYPGEYGLMFTDGAKFGRAEQLHVALWALLEYEARHNQLPEPHNDADAAEVLEIAKAGLRHLSELTEGKDVFKVDELDENVVKQAAIYASVELQPLAAFFGGIVAQEIVKFTGKFTPLKQWLHFDAFEVLPAQRPTDFAPQGSRYDHVITAFGFEFQQRLANVRTFLVGCGALGCEYLKNFAMLGVACGEKGLVTVTDNDRIEVSNLNRQFLFREHNVGQPKSVAATNAVKAMNGSLKVKALEQFVGPHTENVFDDDFWTDMDIVTNALDNVKARLYVDSKCVFHKLPLLESGTLGTKCNVQVVIPYKTQSYADGPKDAEDDNIPMCTLRNFPSLIEHCIEWSRAQFEDLFVVPIAEAKKFTENRDAYLTKIRQATVDHPNPKVGFAAIAQELERLRQLRMTLEKGRAMTFEKCVQLALDLMTTSFRDRILQLIHNFPEDHLTNTGERFWSGAKRFPQAILDFDVQDTLHLNFVRSTANILAVCFGLQPPPEKELVPVESEWREPTTFEHLAKEHAIPEWKPTGEKIATDSDDLKRQEEERLKSLSDNDRQELLQLLEQFETLDLNGLNFEPADFEKDQDLNFHIDFVYAASNLRAHNYKIRQASRHKCKMIAGKIIPAIATTTASVTGLAMLEMLKLVQQKDLDAFKDSSNSLGLNMYLMQEPAPPEKAKDEYDVVEMSEVVCKPSGFTKWDSTLIELSSEATLSNFLDAFKNATELNCDLLFHGVAEAGPSKDDVRYQNVSGLMLYDRNAYGKSLKELYEQQLSQPLRQWVETRYEGLVDCSRKYVAFQTSCSDDNGSVYRVPTVICKFV